MTGSLYHCPTCGDLFVWNATYPPNFLITCPWCSGNAEWVRVAYGQISTSEERESNADRD